MTAAKKKAFRRPNPADLRRWAEEGIARSHSHMVMVAADEDHGSYPIYLNPGDGSSRFDALQTAYKDDGSTITAVYCLVSGYRVALDDQLCAKSAWFVSWDKENVSKGVSVGVEFKGLTYYGVRYMGSKWVGLREMSYCFTEDPADAFFTTDPTRAKVWCHTRITELKKVIAMGKQYDPSRYEIVNMHTGDSAPLSRIHLEDPLTL